MERWEEKPLLIVERAIEGSRNRAINLVNGIETLQPLSPQQERLAVRFATALITAENLSGTNGEAAGMGIFLKLAFMRLNDALRGSVPPEVVTAILDRDFLNHQSVTRTNHSGEIPA